MFSRREISSTLAAACFAALSACSRTAPTPPASPLHALVPPSTRILVGLDFDALRPTTTYQKFVASRKIPQLDEFAAETGLDPRRDLKQLLITGDGAGAFAVLARGDFPPATEIEKKLPASRLQHIPYKTYTLTGTEQAAFVRLDPHLVVAGPLTALRPVLDLRESGAAPAVPILQLASTVPEANQVWIVTTGGLKPPVPLSGNLANLNQVFDRLRQTTLALDLRQGANLSAAGLCGNEEDARQIRTFLKGVIGLGRLNSPSGQPELLRFFDSIIVSQNQTTVTLKAEIPQDLLESLIQLALPKYQSR